MLAIPVPSPRSNAAHIGSTPSAKLPVCRSRVRITTALSLSTPFKQDQPGAVPKDSTVDHDCSATAASAVGARCPTRAAELHYPSGSPKEKVHPHPKSIIVFVVAQFEATLLDIEQLQDVLAVDCEWQAAAVDWLSIKTLTKNKIRHQQKHVLFDR